MNILPEIQQAIEEVTGKPLHADNDNLKLFCGLARQHDLVNHYEIAAYLNKPQSNVSYYVKKHSFLSSNLSYRKTLKFVERRLIALLKEV